MKIVAVKTDGQFVCSMQERAPGCTPFQVVTAYIRSQYKIGNNPSFSGNAHIGWIVSFLADQRSAIMKARSLNRGMRLKYLFIAPVEQPFFKYLYSCYSE